MIRRIVQLPVKKENIEDFKELFQSIKNKVASSEGCHGVELLQDVNDPSIFFTYSLWDAEEYLHQYKSTPFFGVAWKSIKALLGDKPAAWSTEVINASNNG